MCRCGRLACRVRRCVVRRRVGVAAKKKSHDFAGGGYLSGSIFRHLRVGGRSGPAFSRLPAGRHERRSLNHRSLNRRHGNRGNGYDRLMHPGLHRRGRGRGDGGRCREGRAHFPNTCGGKKHAQEREGAQRQGMEALPAQGKKTVFEHWCGRAKKPARGKPPQCGQRGLAGAVYANCGACGRRYGVAFVPAHISFRLRLACGGVLTGLRGPVACIARGRPQKAGAGALLQPVPRCEQWLAHAGLASACCCAVFSARQRKNTFFVAAVVTAQGQKLCLKLRWRRVFRACAWGS